MKDFSSAFQGLSSNFTQLFPAHQSSKVWKLT